MENIYPPLGACQFSNTYRLFDDMGGEYEVLNEYEVLKIYIKEQKCVSVFKICIAQWTSVF